MKIGSTCPAPAPTEDPTSINPSTIEEGASGNTGTRRGRRSAITTTTLMAKQQSAAAGKKKGKTKAKPELVTPAEFARRLCAAAGPSRTASVSQYLTPYVIFYAGGDLTYASARTRGCMSYVRVSRTYCRRLSSDISYLLK